MQLDDTLDGKMDLQASRRNRRKSVMPLKAVAADNDDPEIPDAYTITGPMAQPVSSSPSS